MNTLLQGFESVRAYIRYFLTLTDSEWNYHVENYNVSLLN